MIFKRKDEHFNDFGYQEEIDINAIIVNSEQDLGSVSKYSIIFNILKIFNNFLINKD